MRGMADRFISHHVKSNDSPRTRNMQLHAAWKIIDGRSPDRVEALYHTGR